MGILGLGNDFKYKSNNAKQEYTATFWPLDKTEILPIGLIFISRSSFSTLCAVHGCMHRKKVLCIKR